MHIYWYIVPMKCYLSAIQVPVNGMHAVNFNEESLSVLTFAALTMTTPPLPPNYLYLLCTLHNLIFHLFTMSCIRFQFGPFTVAQLLRFDVFHFCKYFLGYSASICHLFTLIRSFTFHNNKHHSIGVNGISS